MGIGGAPPIQRTRPTRPRRRSKNESPGLWSQHLQPAQQLSLHSQAAKFGHHPSAGHVRVGQHPGGVGGRGWCRLERFPSCPPWL